MRIRRLPPPPGAGAGRGGDWGGVRGGEDSYPDTAPSPECGFGKTEQAGLALERQRRGDTKPAEPSPGARAGGAGRAGGGGVPAPPAPPSPSRSRPAAGDPGSGQAGPPARAPLVPAGHRGPSACAPHAGERASQAGKPSRLRVGGGWRRRCRGGGAFHGHAEPPAAGRERGTGVPAPRIAADAAPAPHRARDNKSQEGEGTALAVPATTVLQSGGTRSGAIPPFDLFTRYLRLQRAPGGPVTADLCQRRDQDSSQGGHAPDTNSILFNVSISIWGHLKSPLCKWGHNRKS